VIQDAARAQGIEALPVAFVSRGEELDSAFVQAVLLQRAEQVIE
jgi:hypothetical protein